MMNLLKQHWLSIVLITFFTLISGYLYSQNVGLRDSLLRLKATPRIDLYALTEFNKTGYHAIKISGFVAFKNRNNQPKDLGQYYMIESLLGRDNKGKQLFQLRKIIAFYNLAPKELDPILLKIKVETTINLILEDTQGNTFTIDKLNQKVTMNDITGDNTYLITSQSEFQDFILDLLR